MDAQPTLDDRRLDLGIAAGEDPRTGPPDYLLGSSAHETERLILQDQIYRPITRRLFQSAGIGPGMSVLDLGCGAGDVSLLLAELVGPKGRVLGIDMDPAVLQRARERVAAAGWRNVELRQGRIDALDLEPSFDAVVGRWILMYSPDPAAVLGELKALLKPGGILAFAEMDIAVPPRTFPQSSLDASLSRWMVPPEGATGPDVRIGTKLYRLFVDAGLPGPEMLLEAPLGGGPEWPGYKYIGETLRSLVPALARVPGFDATKIDVDCIIEQLRSEVTAASGIQRLPALVGAWTRVR
jgi:SAM-dependent methyltransferase